MKKARTAVAIVIIALILVAIFIITVNTPLNQETAEIQLTTI